MQSQRQLKHGIMDSYNKDIDDLLLPLALSAGALAAGSSSPRTPSEELGVASAILPAADLFVGLICVALRRCAQTPHLSYRRVGPKLPT